MAKEIILKLNLDAGNAPQTIDSLEASLESMRTDLKGLNIDSKAFKDLSAKVRAADTQVKNLNMSIEGLDTEAMAGEVGKFAGGMGAAMAGVSVLAADADEDMQKLVKSVGSAIIVGQAFQGAIEGTIALTKMWKAAQQALNIAMKANPIGLAIAAVALLVAGITGLVFWLKRETEAQKIRNEVRKESNKLIGEETSKVNLLFNDLKLLTEQTNLRAESLEEINKKYGIYLPNLLTETSSLKDIEKAQKLVINGLKDKIKLKVLEAKALKITNNMIKEEERLAASGKGRIWSYELEEQTKLLKGVLNAYSKIQKARKDIFKQDTNLGNADKANQLNLKNLSENIEKEIQNIRISNIDNEFDRRRATQKIIYEGEVENIKDINRTNLAIFNYEYAQKEKLEEKLEEKYEKNKKELLKLGVTKATDSIIAELDKQKKRVSDLKTALDEKYNKEVSLLKKKNNLVLSIIKSEEEANTKNTERKIENERYISEIKTKKLEAGFLDEEEKTYELLKINYDVQAKSLDDRITSAKEGSALETQLIDEMMALNFKYLKDLYDTEDRFRLIKIEKEAANEIILQDNRRRNALYIADQEYEIKLNSIGSIWDAEQKLNVEAIRQQLSLQKEAITDEKDFRDDANEKALKNKIISDEEYEKTKLEIKKDYLKQFELAEEASDRKIGKEKRKTIAKLAELATQIAQATINKIATETQRSFEDELHWYNVTKDAEAQRNDEALEVGLITQKQYDIKQQEIDDAKENKDLEIRIKQFEAKKRAALFGLAIDTAAAGINIWATTPTPAVPFALAALGVSTAASLMAINSEDVPSYSDGGLVMGVGGPREDNINARVSAGESIMTAKTTAMFPSVLSTLNQMGGGVAIGNETASLGISDAQINRLIAGINDKKVYNVATDTTRVSNKVKNIQKNAQF